MKRSLTVRDRRCGNPGEMATVAFENDQVVVTGRITGRDSCATAVLGDVSYDPGTGTGGGSESGGGRLRVVVATESQPPAGATCAQCLTEIRYQAVLAFENGLPETVEVLHRGAGGETQVTTVERGQ